MSLDLDLVRTLKPEPREEDPAEMRRQRSLLLDEIGREPAVLPVRSASRRRRSLTLRILAATVALAAVGGGTAFAVTSLAPDGPQSVTVQRHYQSARGVHVPGWRPELDAERVVCDYRNVASTAPLVYSYASEFPLATPLTEQRLVDECRAGTDAVRSEPVSNEALLCSVTPPGERFPVPAITFAFSTCGAAQLDAAGPQLLADRNRLRRTETAIRAVPEECPTAAEALRWVRPRVAESPDALRIDAAEDYPGARCFLPFVHWGRGTVEVVAQISEPAAPGPGTAPTTVPPPTS